jgi:Domain of unknown function (DUF4157)
MMRNSQALSAPSMLAKQQAAPLKILQRQCACGQHTDGHQCEECKERALPGQAQGQHRSMTAPPLVHEVLRSSGEPLSSKTRAWAEPLFGRNFSNVRVHHDARAAQSAQSVDALAYTVGQNVVFGSSLYSPTTRAGQKLLVHELAHTVQQENSGGPHLQQAKLAISQPADAAEREAETIADQAMSGRPVRVQERVSRTIHRISRETWGNISLGLGIGSAVAGGIALAAGHGTLGGIGLGLGAVGIIAGLKLRSQSKPVPASIRVAQIHQFPLDKQSVDGGIRSGLGGVAEMEVSNGGIDYEGTEIDEHFLGGACQQRANRSGVGGTGGSTFTVGYGFTNENLPVKIHLPPKRNVFYDQHLFASLQNDPPPGPCSQQYTFNGQVIAGKTFVRSYISNPARINGENVTVCTLDIAEQGPAPGPTQPPASPPATGPTGNAPTASEQGGGNAPAGGQPTN